MLRLLVLSLIVLCMARGSVALCGGCSLECTGTCSAEGVCTQDCCNWDDPPIETDPESYKKFQRSPNGFTQTVLPRVESTNPKPCVYFDIPAEVEGKQNYIQVSVEADGAVCVYEKDREDDKACDSVIYYCNPDGYTGVDTVEFQFDCDGSCPAAELTFYFRVDLQSLDNVDEYWCDNTNRTLPRDLIQDTNTAFTPSDIMTPSVFTDSAPAPLLVAPALLVISLLIAALFSV